MALSSSAGQIAIMGGPAAGGLLLLAGPAEAYGGCLGLLGLALILATFLRYRHVPAARAPMTLDSLLAGALFVWERKVLLGALSLDLFAVLLGGVTALLPMFARDVLQVGPAGLECCAPRPPSEHLRWRLSWRVCRSTGASACA